MNTNGFDVSVSDDEEKAIAETINPHTVGTFFSMAIKHHFDKIKNDGNKKSCEDQNSKTK